MKNNYKISLFIAFLSCFSISVQGQTTFQKIYSGFYGMDGLDVIPAIDGGYIITGMINNDIIDDIDIHIIKTNSTGDKMWEKSYGGVKPEYSFGILKASDDSGYYIIGYSRSFGGGDSDTWLLKIKVNGDTAWTKTYGSWGNDFGKEIIPTSDGNYMMVGYSNGLGGPNYDAFLIKTKPDGDVIWEKKYGGTNTEFGNSVKQTPDGGYIMLGQTFSYGVNGDAYLVKTNSTGDETWYKTYGGAQNDEGIFVLANSDGTYTFCVRDSSTAGTDVDVQIIKTQTDGTVIWDKNYGGNKKDTDKMIQPTSDGGYVVAAISRSFNAGPFPLPDMWILKLKDNGDTLWTKSYGGQDNEHCYSVRQTSDGGYIAIGKTESFSSEDGIMFLKLNPSGNLGSVSVDEYFSDNNIIVHPNPTDGMINIDLNKNIVSGSLKIVNVLGQTIHSEIFSTQGNKNRVVNLIGQEPGVYFISIQSENKLITKKIIVNK
ncbi:MAG: T9SS type A sorting domain-containing protein [Bacteroidota bacterium]